MTILDLQVLASADDAKEASNGSMDLTHTFLQLYDPNTWGGFRFQNVIIPVGATIDSATLQGYILSTTRDDIDTDIYGEAAGDPAPFTTTGFDISNRTRTNAKSTETAGAVGIGWHTFPELIGVISEIISQPGWALGNELAIIFDSLAGQNLAVQAYDFDTSLATKLSIEFTPQTEPLGEIKDPIFWHVFYLPQFEEVQADPPVNLDLSPSTICLCLQALILAENRNYWRKDLRELNDTQWDKAENFLTTAIDELTA